MAVYFVYRCHYGAPSEKHVRRFEYDTVLDWAQAVWKPFDTYEAADAYAVELLGGLRVYSIGDLFYTDPEYGTPRRPHTMEDVRGLFESMYDPTIESGPHHIQMMTDDDEIDMAVYVFDDHYRAANPGKADFLLLPDWELPAGASDEPPPDLGDIETDLLEPRGAGEGVLYAFYEAPGSDNLRDKNECDTPYRVEGVRVPDLARHLLCLTDTEELYFVLAEVREGLVKLLAQPAGEDAGFLAAIRDQPTEGTHWDAYSDWLQERDLPASGLHLLERALRSEKYSLARNGRKPAFDRVKVTPHMAQACKHEGRWYGKPVTDEITHHDTFGQFIFFDDKWAAAHPTLARSILTFASRWDVLSDGPTEPVE
ncbi:MAG: TIGR02996 domain-containing protein [Gemmataceae bacterium]|nr:TIGR02996 domain-containing protein [Gemmataceae bacterium]